MGQLIEYYLSMKTNTFKTLTIMVAATTFSITIALMSIGNTKNLEPIYGDHQQYTLLLDNRQRITTNNEPSLEEITNTVLTSMNNEIILSGYKVTNNVNGWQIIQPGGYVYNPINESLDHNKISGIKSITYEGNDSLEIHYG